MRKHYSLITFALLPLLACGGSKDNGDDVGTIDAHQGSGSNTGSGGCTAEASYSGALTSQNSQSGGSGSDQEIFYFGNLNTDASPDLLDIELYAGDIVPGGVFDPNITAQSIPLTGDNADYIACAACVQIWTDTTTGSDGVVSPGEQYQATAGTLNLTSVSGTLTATITGATFTHVDFGSDGTQTNATDGCTSTTASESVSATIEVDTGSDGSGSAFAPTGSGPKQVQVQMLRHRVRAN